MTDQKGSVDWQSKPLWVAVLLAVALVLVWNGGVAEAELAHYSDDAASAAFGTLEEPTQVAVDEANDYVYLTTSPRRVERFTTAGAPAPFASLGTNAITKTGPGNGPSAEGFGYSLGEVAVDAFGNFFISDPERGTVNMFSQSGSFIRAIGADLAPNTPGVTVPNTPAGSFYPWLLTLNQSGTELYVGDGSNGGVDKFNPTTGAFIGQPVNGSQVPATLGLEVDGDGNIYTSDGYTANVRKFNPAGTCLAPCPFVGGGAWGLAIDSVSGNVYFLQTNGSAIVYSPQGERLAELRSDPEFFSFLGIAFDSETGTVYLPNRSEGSVEVFHPILLPKATTGNASNVLDVSANLEGHIEPDGGGPITECKFEYGQTESYELGSVPCAPAASPGTPISTPTNITATIAGVQPDTIYHYRVAATNATGKPVDAYAHGEGRTFTTLRAPTIEVSSASDLTPKTADLHAQINPHGADTAYRFQYGTTPEYEITVPVPDGSIPAGNEAIEVSVHIDNLQVGVPYHFRVIAENAFGKVVSEDQTFSFFTSNCPNALVRQETSSNTLPDCRAYELVSPEDASGTALFTVGPTSPTATNPSRFAFSGMLGIIPGTGEPVNAMSDLYVATRTVTGWKTKYVGLPGSKVSMMGEAPPYPGFIEKGWIPQQIQRGVLTDPDMSLFVNWNLGNALSKLWGCCAVDGNEVALASKAPYVWDWQGNQVDRWPTNLMAVPGGYEVHEGPYQEYPIDEYRGFAGDVTASSDLNHFFFSSREVAYVHSASPGSAYDNEISSGSVEVISKAPGGGELPREEFVRFPRPSSSSDGSHVLMSPEGDWSDAERTPSPARLYMRVNGLVTFDVSRGAAVRYIGMTPDGGSVFFISSEKLTSDDHDTSADLFRWDEAPDTLTRLSVGDGSGDTDACSTSWVERCGVEPFTGNQAVCKTTGGIGGNCHSDSSIAERTGEIYFFSPERLDNFKGVNGKENLYVFRNGHPQFVATFTSGPYCGFIPFDPRCTDGPVARMQVTPSGSHVAFTTASRLTSYDTAGYLQMYVYEPAADRLVCASCIPSGEAPKFDVLGSQNGRFITDDGRTFFYSSDAIVPQDTNEIGDVYEYVDGRPQLITSGTGAVDVPGEAGRYLGSGSPGLAGVTADGTDVYFGTYDVLVGQDRNGNQLKFYDARVGGGFPFKEPPPKCVAADECHGPSSQPPSVPPAGSGARLGKSGNFEPPKSKKGSKKRGKRSKKKRHNSKSRGRRHG